MADMQTIQWFPGHMAKTKRKIAESLHLVDAVVEIVDSRIPVSSRNPELAGIIDKKPHIILLNKCDLSDSTATKNWADFYKKQGKYVIITDSKSGMGVNNFQSAIFKVLAYKLEKFNEKGMVGKKLRLMVVGIPNVGKSSFINKLCKNTRAKVEDRPGVTRGNQWYTVNERIELLDTPGMLWPKFDDQVVGEHLAFCGSVKDEIIDRELLAMRLAEFLGNNYPELLIARYKLKETELEAYELLCAIGKARGMVIRGGEVDTERASVMLLDEFRAGKIGRITLEYPEKETENA